MVLREHEDEHVSICAGPLVCYAHSSHGRHPLVIMSFSLAPGDLGPICLSLRLMWTHAHHAEAHPPFESTAEAPLGPLCRRGSLSPGNTYCNVCATRGALTQPCPIMTCVPVSAPRHGDWRSGRRQGLALRLALLPSQQSPGQRQARRPAQ